jgi:formylglycine-generating enzyme required for sulfatase activity
MIRSYLFVVLLAAALPSFSQEPAFSNYSREIPGSKLSFKMVAIKGGSFLMGSAKTDKAAKPDEGPAKSIELSPYWIGAYEVTYDEYDAFFKDESFSRNQVTDAVTRPSPPYIDLTLGMGKEGGFPANSMSHYGALMFCRWLYKKTGEFYRLPTEAEWEYACRAGTTTVYPFGNDAASLTKFAWFDKDSENKYHKVGEKEANAWGLYDMLGNVAEWTMDQYDEKYFAGVATAKDPLVPATARHPRTLKGGNYQDPATMLRPSARLRSNLDWNRRDPQIPRSRWWNADAPFVGFRIVRPAKKPTEAEIEKFFADYIDNF